MEQRAFNLFGRDLFGAAIQLKAGPLARRFTMPPFSVLDARSGEWRERKRAWLALGIKSELGRGGNALKLSERCKEKWVNGRLGRTYNIGDKKTWEAGLTYRGRAAAFDFYRVQEGIRSDTGAQGTSVFDPVLTELMLTWFCPPGGLVLDPFAGGSVRGIVAALLGFRYFGIDLRLEQIEANRQQAEEICNGNKPTWLCGDALELLDSAPEAHFVFSCPPYGCLERYSDDPRDLSTIDDYPTFFAAYKRIILRCAKKLKPDCLACFVVGDFRDKKTGNYRGFVADTVNAFRECGFHLHNDAVLVTAVGSLPIRVSAQFEKNRKLGKTHQNVLVFGNGGGQ